MIDETQQSVLLSIAREAVSCAAHEIAPPDLNLDEFTQDLRIFACSFVTLTRSGALRGCIGCLEPEMPLVLDVQKRAYSAACQDFRFPPVDVNELNEIDIEVSVLTPAVNCAYRDNEDLLAKIQQNRHGVVLKHGNRRATFLPQVWKKIHNKEKFLDHLCLKMGLHSEFWRMNPVEVYLYEVLEFHE
jgi:AmmeMemoRadiSam system protein A